MRRVEVDIETVTSRTVVLRMDEETANWLRFYLAGIKYHPDFNEEMIKLVCAALREKIVVDGFEA